MSFLAPLTIFAGSIPTTFTRKLYLFMVLSLRISKKNN